MTTRTRKQTPRQGRIGILAALGAASIALIAASPANAIYRDYESTDSEPPVAERIVDNQNEQPPVDENGKKSCPIANLSGGVTYYPHGTVVTVKTPKGNPVSAKCNDGDWEAALVQPGDRYHHYEADEASVDGSGTLTMVNPHAQHTYSADGGYYAQP